VKRLPCLRVRWKRGLVKGNFKVLSKGSRRSRDFLDLPAENRALSGSPVGKWWCQGVLHKRYTAEAILEILRYGKFRITEEDLMIGIRSCN